MSSTYTKIDTLFEREGKYVNPERIRRAEFTLINSWWLTEKIDGTNIRLHFEDAGYTIEGRTDNAQIPAQLGNFLRGVCEKIQPHVSLIRGEHELDSLTLFGEGFGAKINSGGRYSATPRFALFDVLAGAAWLDDEQVSETARRLHLLRVPVVMFPGTIQQAVTLVQDGFPSLIADDKTLPAEGIVARPAVPLFDRRHQRVMWKLKSRDFETS